MVSTNTKYQLKTRWLWRRFSEELRNYKSWVFLCHKVPQILKKILQSNFLKKAFHFASLLNTENLYFNNLGERKANLSTHNKKPFVSLMGLLIILNKMSAIVQLHPLYCHLFHLEGTHIPGWWIATYSK